MSSPTENPKYIMVIPRIRANTATIMAYLATKIAISNATEAIMIKSMFMILSKDKEINFCYFRYLLKILFMVRWNPTMPG